MKKIGRTSTDARHASAPLRAQASASSRSVVSSIQKPPMCSFASRYGSIREEHFTIGLRAECAGGAQTAGELPDAGSDHFAIERVNLLHHSRVLCGWVKVVGQVTRNEKLRHVVS